MRERLIELLGRRVSRACVAASQVAVDREPHFLFGQAWFASEKSDLLLQNADIWTGTRAFAAQTQMKSDGQGTWLTALKRYFGAILAGNLVWEFVQLPLYTLWHEGPWGRIVFAAVHCTGGDLLIGGAALMIALLLIGDGRWPHAGFGRVAIVAGGCGLAYTVFSEWLNTEIRFSWAYTIWMPIIPVIGTGLSPFLQWLVVPSLAFWWARPRIDPAGRVEAHDH
jgi:hypothetical protein